MTIHVLLFSYNCTFRSTCWFNEPRKSTNGFKSLRVSDTLNVTCNKTNAPSNVSFNSIWIHRKSVFIAVHFGNTLMIQFECLSLVQYLLVHRLIELHDEISCSDQHFLQRRRRGWNCSWVITLYHCYLGLWWDVNLSDLPGAAQRAEFKAGHPGAKLATGPAEEHQPATTCILLLAQSPWIWTPAPTLPSLHRPL